MTARTVGVVGSGNIARALAAQLASRGHRVRLYARDAAKLEDVRSAGSITATGMLEGTFPVESVTGDVTRAADCSTIVIATVTTAYEDVAAALGPALDPDHLVVTFSSKLFGSVLVDRCLAEHGAPSTVDVVETDSILAARVLDDGTVALARKGWNLLSGPREAAVDEHLPFLADVFPGLEKATNLVHRGVNDFGALAHVVISYANLSKIDRGEPVLFYEEGLSERTVALLERMEGEFAAVAKAYDAELVPMTEVLDRYYGVLGCDTSSLLAAMRSVLVYKGVKAPTSVDDRLLYEDVSSTLVPLRALAAKAGVETPMVDAMVTMASTVAGQDFRQTGRTLDRLGLDGMSWEGIRAWLHR